ncbi:NAD(P)H-quinone oxidoreductase subunit 1, chloroplastic [Campylobacter majalis]|uniref:NAD(P)H-quinone oxidoreductase subunit 1, chloroplastic n=1 Tax=Campylobacter majalis TaxID=2790656 RepID=A0ABN7KB27_9BACT|nr:NADH-quinone oxidoreductase subunit H [Campylobacter majalis]CAD7288100.1 NAD(P)H-quinone oxidoreductase subunit 1, chloroplastic [Campylobacter majalis]
MMSFTLMVLQLLALLAIAPLFDGIARKLRAKYQARHGVPIMQTYYDMYKLISRGRVMPTHANPLYKYVPFILVATSAAMFCALPIMYAGTESIGYSDVFVLLYLGAFFKFVYSAAAVDSANPFAGVSASRETMLGVYVEPIIMLSLCVVVFSFGTSSMPEIKNFINEGGYVKPSIVVAGIAFLWAMYVETGRKPYDLAEAEQELQEGLLSEYSGRDLALIQTSLLLKQFSMLGFFLLLFIPSCGNAVFDLVLFIALAGALYILAIFIDNFSPRYKMISSLKTNVLTPTLIAALGAVLYILGV